MTTKKKNISWSLLAVIIMITTAIPQVIADDIEPTSTIEFDTPLPEGMEVTISAPTSEPTDDPEGGGWKASLFFIYSNRFMTDTGRMKLDGWSFKEIVWFNGYDHESQAEGYMEFWYTDDGEEKYHCSGYTFVSEWSGFAFLVIGLEVTIYFPDHEQYEVTKIHVYTERVVDDFETEYYNKVFYEYIINQFAEQAASVKAVQDIISKDVLLE